VEGADGGDHADIEYQSGGDLMSIFRNFGMGVRNLFQRPRVEADLDDEVRGYVEERIADKMRTGMTCEEAARETRLEVGSATGLKESVRDVGWEQRIESLSQDTRFGLRMLRKSPALTVVAVLTLALGIGANSAMFGIVYGLLYRPLPFPEAENIAAVHMNFSPQNARRGTMCVADFVDWQKANTAFEKIAAYGLGRFTLTGDAQAEEVTGASVTAEYFSILGTKPIVGRTFEAGDDSGTAANLVVINESLWRRRFGGDPGVVGRVVDVNGNPATIIGVVREKSGFPRPNMEVWKNLPLKVTRRGPFSLRGLGRLRTGISLQQAQAETDLIGRNIERANPSNYSRLSMPVESLRESLVGDLRPALWMMLAAVLTVLLIAIVNIANLLLARATTRGREMAVRLSLGASRTRLVQQLLTESVLLSLVGAGVGLGLAWGVVRIFRAVNPAKVPMVGQVQLDWNVLLFTVAIAVGAGVLFGVAPAFQSARADLQGALKSGGRSGTAGSVHLHSRGVLVVTEIALSLVLLVAAGLLLRSFVLLRNVDVGTTASPEKVLTMAVTPSSVRGVDMAASMTAMTDFQTRVLENVSHLPGVRYAAISDALPPNLQTESDTFSIAGRPWTDQEFPSTTLPKISPDFFRALGVPLLRGRYFDAHDAPNSQPVVIINEALAKRYFPNVDPIGQKIRASGPTNTDPYMDVVGVVGDMKFWGLDSEFKPAYFVPYTQYQGGTRYLVVQSSEDAAALAPMIEREIHALDQNAVVRKPVTLQELLGDSVAQPRFRTYVLAGFGMLALVLAAVGIYGVIAYSVTQRTQEIGIRMALGAQRFDVLKMVVRYGATLAAVGIGIGLVASLATARVMSGFLFATKASDPMILASGCALLLGVAMTAALVPAVRAMRIDPQEALRQE
jgi:putative ABC transport system permease protein